MKVRHLLVGQAVSVVALLLLLPLLDDNGWLPLATAAVGGVLSAALTVRWTRVHRDDEP